MNFITFDNWRIMSEMPIFETESNTGNHGKLRLEKLVLWLCKD